MSRSAGLIALLTLAILAIAAVTGLTGRVRVEPAPTGAGPQTSGADPAPTDAGSLDSVLDAIHIEHFLKHGR